MGDGAVAGHAHDLSTEFANRGDLVAERACFLGATGGIVARIKVEDQVFPGDQILERDFVAVAIGKSESGGLFSFLGRFFSASRGFLGGSSGWHGGLPI